MSCTTQQRERSMEVSDAISEPARRAGARGWEILLASAARHRGGVELEALDVVRGVKLGRVLQDGQMESRVTLMAVPRGGERGLARRCRSEE